MYSCIIALQTILSLMPATSYPKPLEECARAQSWVEHLASM